MYTATEVVHHSCVNTVCYILPLTLSPVFSACNDRVQKRQRGAVFQCVSLLIHWGMSGVTEKKRKKNENEIIEGKDIRYKFQCVRVRLRDSTATKDGLLQNVRC